MNFDKLSNNVEIANYLADAHQANCSPNTSQFNDKLRNEYFAFKNLKTGNNPPYSSISTEIIDKAIHKIQTKTTPGPDNIHINHFKFAHPSVIIILKALFNIFLFIGEVPIAFGNGVVTPIPK